MLADTLVTLRYDFRLLAEEGTLPKWQVVDILLDFDDPAVSHYILWKLHPILKTPRVYVTWDEVDEAIGQLEVA